MEDTLLGMVDDFKVFVMSGIQTLPLTMAGTLLVLGFGTANYPMLFCLVGMLVVAPILPFLINLAADDTWNTPGGGLIPGPSNHIIPQWFVLVYFFLAYMMTNAILIYQIEPADADDTQKTALRKSQCGMGIIVVGLCMVVLGAIQMTGLQGGKIGLAFLGMIIGAGIGVGWYYALNTSGQGRLADLFGIANRLLTPSAFVNEPVGCVPIA